MEAALALGQRNCLPRPSLTAGNSKLIEDLSRRLGVLLLGGEESASKFGVLVACYTLIINKLDLLGNKRPDLISEARRVSSVGTLTEVGNPLRCDVNRRPMPEHALLVLAFATVRDTSSRASV